MARRKTDRRTYRARLPALVGPIDRERGNRHQVIRAQAVQKAKRERRSRQWNK